MQARRTRTHAKHLKTSRFCAAVCGVDAIAKVPSTAAALHRATIAARRQLHPAAEIARVRHFTRPRTQPASSATQVLKHCPQPIAGAMPFLSAARQLSSVTGGRHTTHVTRQHCSVSALTLSVHLFRRSRLSEVNVRWAGVPVVRVLVRMRQCVAPPTPRGARTRRPPPSRVGVSVVRTDSVMASTPLPSG